MASVKCHFILDRWNWRCSHCCPVPERLWLLQAILHVPFPSHSYFWRACSHRPNSCACSCPKPFFNADVVGTEVGAGDCPVCYDFYNQGCLYYFHQLAVQRNILASSKIFVQRLDDFLKSENSELKIIVMHN